MSPTVTIRHSKTDLALHRLTDEDTNVGPPLLLVHGLGERSPESVPPSVATWPGPVWALDLTGHGASSMSVGGGYTGEMLMADVDAALAHIGPATICGRGLGAWVALLIAGARPDLVQGAILDDGPGLTGGGAEPPTPFVLTEALTGSDTPDPYALMELGHDVRPPDYATTYARQATNFSPLDTVIAVCAVTRPPWLAAVADEPGVRVLPRDEALALFAGLD